MYVNHALASQHQDGFSVDIPMTNPALNNYRGAKEVGIAHANNIYPGSFTCCYTYWEVLQIKNPLGYK